MAARALLDEEGVGAISMREVTRRAGVTHQAPYHHFADRDSILAELVAQGFDELAQRLAQARKGGQTPLQCLSASGQAYIAFALDQPGTFRIMFRQDLCDPLRHERASAAGMRAHQPLQQMVVVAYGQADAQWAHMHWAQAHGLAGLLLDGPLGQQLRTPVQRRRFVREMLDTFAAQMLATTSAPLTASS